MSFVVRLGRGRVLVLLVAALLAGMVLSPAAGVTASLQAVGAAPLADLAAMTLTPADLAQAGMLGYGFDYGQVVYAEQIAGPLGEDLGLSEDEMLGSLRDAGFRRWYENYLYLPVDPAEPRGALVGTVGSYVVEFADGEGAATAWEWFEDETGIPEAEDVPLTRAIGDQSEATRLTGEDTVTGEPYQALDVSVRTGRFHVGVRLVDWTGAEPDVATGETLIAPMLARVVATLATNEPALGNQAARLTGDTVEVSIDGYLFSDGEAVRLLGESEESLGQRERTLNATGYEAHYRVWQRVAPGADPAGDVWYYLELYRLADAAAASDWMAGIEERVTGNAAFTDFRLDAAQPALGDESIIYTLRTADGVSSYRSVAIRVGATVAVIDLQGPTIPPAEALQPIAEAQAACLGADGCLDPVPVPAPLEAYIAGSQPALEATPELAQPVASPSPEPQGQDQVPVVAGGEAYTSQRYPYTVTWDPEAWTLGDEPGDDGIALNLDGSSLSQVVIEGVDGYGGDPIACLQGMVDEAERQTPLAPSTRYPAPVTVDDAVGAVYELGGFGVAYLECRTLVPGESVLQVRYAGPESDYGAALPALEGLLAGIVVGDE